MKPLQKKALNDTMYGGDTNPNSGPIGFLYGENDGGGGGNPSMEGGSLFSGNNDQFDDNDDEADRIYDAMTSECTIISY